MASKAAESEKKDDVFILRRSTNPDETPYWQSDVAKVLQPRTRTMLETYSNIPPDKVEARVREIQKRSWAVAPFASVGALTWLNPYILLLPQTQYERILEKAKSGASIVDCACMVAPDLRQMAWDGAPTENMYGFDLEEEFSDIGFDLFNDGQKWEGQFFQADAMKAFEETKLGTLVGKMDIVWCAKFVHLFDRAGQIDMMSRLVSLLKPQAGSMFVGSQNGFPGGKEVKIADGKRFANQTDRFLLADAPEVREMWREVAERTGTDWEIEARLLDMSTIGLHEDDGSPYKKLTGYNLQW